MSTTTFLENRKTASEKEKENFLNDFSKEFNKYINSELKEYYKKLHSDKYYKYEKFGFKVQFKIENQPDILSKIKKKCDEIKKLPSSEQVNRLIEICNNESESSFDVLNIKQVQSEKKKGYFKTMIMEVEKICEEKNINLLISQIMNYDFANMLKNNGYYIIKDGIVDVNAIKIFQTVEKTLKRKREEAEAESEAKRKKIEFEEENICAICRETLMDIDKVFIRLSCGHGFHKECILDLCKLGKNECPICKKIFNIDDIDNENKVKTSTNPLDFIQYKPNSSKKSDGKSKRKSKRKKSKRKSIRKSIRKYKRKFIRKSIKKSKRKSKNFA